MTKNNNNDSPANPARRNLLKNAGFVGVAVASGTVASVAVPGSGASAQVITTDSSSSQQPAVREALETLTAAEAETLDALVDRILPADQNGPGAREARAIHYIDRSLASDNLSSRADYAIGLGALNEFALKQQDKPFHQLNQDQQDELIDAVIAGNAPGFSPSGGGFFAMVRNHTIQGTFSDPYYGGNRDFIGWDMLGYPGVRVGASEDEIALGRALAPNHQSAYDIPMFTKKSVSRGTGNGR